jgi:hypothetical protein
VIADLEAGYGDAGETVWRAIGVGVVGANLSTARLAELGVARVSFGPFTQWSTLATSRTSPPTFTRAPRCPRDSGPRPEAHGGPVSRGGDAQAVTRPNASPSSRRTSYSSTTRNVSGNPASSSEVARSGLGRGRIEDCPTLDRTASGCVTRPGKRASLR